MKREIVYESVRECEREDGEGEGRKRTLRQKKDTQTEK
jgi:hypothetical protein